jgi:hypothetical protein
MPCVPDPRSALEAQAHGPSVGFGSPPCPQVETVYLPPMELQGHDHEHLRTRRLCVVGISGLPIALTPGTMGCTATSAVCNVSTDRATDPFAAGRHRGDRLGRHPSRVIDCHVEPAQRHGLVQDLRLSEYHGLGPLRKPRRFSPGFLTYIGVCLPLIACICWHYAMMAAQRPGRYAAYDLVSGAGLRSR